MANVLSEPALPNCASRTSEVHLEKANVPLNDIILAAQVEVDKNPYDPELWIKLGRAYRRQMLHREAIDAYSKGLSYKPFYPLLYRHKGHAYINIGKYAESAASFEIALRLDPTNWDCWYHQGVAYYLMGDYQRATISFERTFCYTELFDDIISSKDWLWLCYTRLGQNDKAAAIVADVKPGHPTQYCDGYYHRVLVYNGTYDADWVVNQASKLDNHEFATYCYGVARWYLAQGEAAKGFAILDRIVKSDDWSGFAEHAALEDYMALSVTVTQ